VYSGRIDEYFQFKYGELPYRSLRFQINQYNSAKLQRIGKPWNLSGFYQPALQVNYPNNQQYTRTVELKHITGQKCDWTTIVKEYPADFGVTQEPFYPIPNNESAAIYEKYRQEAIKCTNVSFIGRLGSYQYYNMDQVVAMALATASKLLSVFGIQK
jgi:UDP-galactopyranose mutase